MATPPHEYLLAKIHTDHKFGILKLAVIPIASQPAKY